MTDRQTRIAVVGLTGNTVFMGVPRFHTGGETISAYDFHAELGGKGFNQAVAAARQGAAVSFLTAVGEEDAQKVRAFLAQEGIAGCVVGKGKPSAHATVLTDGTGETRVTVFPGAQLESADVEAFAVAIAAADMLLLNNEVPDPVNIRAAEIAVAHGVKIVVNPAPARPVPEMIRRAAFLFTPNAFEGETLGDVPGEVVTTLGEKGCRIRSTGEIFPPADCGKVVDTTGAGDTFTATLAVHLAAGEPLAAACRAANRAAGYSVTIRYVLPSLPSACDLLPH